MPESDALKFFHAFIREMIELGGENLPRSIAIRLGSKLAKLYKDRGFTNLVDSLKYMYEVIGAKVKIEQISESEFYIRSKYSPKFCPIGGAFAPGKDSQFLEIVCLPFTIGMMHEFAPNFDSQIEILSCIIQHGGRSCAYRLNLNPKGKVAL